MAGPISALLLVPILFGVTEGKILTIKESYSKGKKGQGSFWAVFPATRTKN